MRSKKLLAALALTLCALCAAWSSGAVPRGLGRLAAEDYVQRRGYTQLRYSHMEFSPAHGSWFAVFLDGSSRPVNLLLGSRYLPLAVSYDPLAPPG